MYESLPRGGAWSAGRIGYARVSALMCEAPMLTWSVVWPNVTSMTVVNVQEAKTQLSRLLTLVEAGEEVVIACYGKRVARLVRIAPAAKERRPGIWRDSLRIAEDFKDELDESWLEPLEP